jgi:Pyridoxamine 5'-phosphate oxidase
MSPDPRPGSPARPGFPGTARRSPSSAIAMSRNEDRCLCTEGDRAHTAAVAAWKDVERAEPEVAARVGRLFDAGRHKTIATLRADGSPRISGIECEFADGELRFGSMPGARKGADLRRDPRFTLQGPVFHPQQGKEAGWPGEAKIAGRAVLAGLIGEGPAGDLFVADISEVVTTRLNPGRRCWSSSRER